MKVKIQYSTFLILVALAFFASCTKEQEDLFPDSSANRADNTIASNIKVLASAQNGWLMEYFPHSQQSYGGYNIIVRFTEDGKVEALSEVDEARHNSLYRVSQSAGMVLTFDTYNLSVHAFSDPAAPLGGSAGAGLEGDYDFSILKATADSVVLKGKKSGNYAKMTPMATDKWEDYLTGITAVEDGMKARKYTLTIGDTAVVAVKDGRTLSFTYVENGEELDGTLSYVVTPEGYKLYSPTEILGQKFSGFTYVEGKDVFPASDNSKVSLAVIYPTLAEIMSEGAWSVTYSGLGATGKQYWDVLPQIQGMLQETLQYVLFGTYSGTFGVTFVSSGYLGSLIYAYQLVSDDEIAVLYQRGNPNDNGAWYVNNAYYGTYLAGPFGLAKEVHVYKLTADDNLNPSWILMTDEEDPDNTILLQDGFIPYPLNN